MTQLDGAIPPRMRDTEPLEAPHEVYSCHKFGKPTKRVMRVTGSTNEHQSASYMLAI